MIRFFGVTLIALVSSLPAAVIAGPYANAVAKQSRCETAGELAQTFFGKSTTELRAAGNDIDKQVREKKIKRVLGEETKYILFMGKTAKSPKDAYMQAWSWCMDQK